jgi:branched-chain amino acid transport system substrate-binding protein
MHPHAAQPIGLRRRIGLFVLLCLLTAVFAGNVASQALAADWREVFASDAAARKTFQAGLDDFRNNDIARAERKFRTLLPAADPADAEAVSLFIAKCLVAQQQYAEAGGWLADCRTKFVDGRYVDMFWYLSGYAAYFQKEPVRAAEYYLEAYRQTRDSRVRELIVASLSPLFTRWLDAAAMRRLAEQIPEGPPAAEFYYRWGERSEHRGRYSLAERNYREVLRQGKNTPRYREARQRLELLRDRLANTARIGLLYPASGPLIDFGIRMMNAAQLAADIWRQDHGGFIEILAEDTHGEALYASAAARRLLDQGVSAIVGPLTSESAVAAANVLACERLLHILPLASQTGLTTLSENLYQLSPTPPIVGETLARYAIDSLGDSVFAIVAPDEPYGHEISLAFQKTALQQGATVFPVQFTQPGQTDYRRELMRIKLIVLRELYDSTVFYTPDGDTLDEEQVPVYFGGFFLPGDADDLNDIVPQIRFYNIFPHCLGTDGWSLPEGLSRAREYLEGAIFASAEYRPDDDPLWARFASAWQNRYGGRPDLVAARTYDGIILAATLMERGGASSDPAGATLSEFNGVSGTITFSPNRENMHVPLYGYHQSRIVPAALMPAPEPPPEPPPDSTFIGPAPEE